MTTNKPIGPDETPEDIGGLLRDVFDLAEELAATVSDEQIEQRLAELLGQDVGQAEEPWSSSQYLLGDWRHGIDLTYMVVTTEQYDVSSFSSWVPAGHSCRAGLEDYVDEQLDRANEITANAQAEAVKIVEEAKEEAARILEDARRLAYLEAFVSNDNIEACDTPIFQSLLSSWCSFTEHQASSVNPPDRTATVEGTAREPASIAYPAPRELVEVNPLGPQPAQRPERAPTAHPW